MALRDEITGAGRELIEQSARSCQLELSDAFEMASSDAGLLTFTDEFSSRVSFNHLLTLDVLAGQRLTESLDQTTLGRVIPRVATDRWRVITLAAIHRVKKNVAVSVPEWIFALFTKTEGGKRPTELMYESWPIIEGAPDGQKILEQFRANETQSAGVREKRISVGNGFVADSVVTSDEYRDFDAEYEGGDSSKAKVSWYDAWCYCVWKQCVLPTLSVLKEVEPTAGDEWTQDSDDDKQLLRSFRLYWES